MDDEKLQRLENLEAIYNRALCICDPIEFQRRQQILLYEIADLLLLELNEYRKISNPNSSERNL